MELHILKPASLAMLDCCDLRDCLLECLQFYTDPSHLYLPVHSAVKDDPVERVDYLYSRPYLKHT